MIAQPPSISMCMQGFSDADKIIRKPVLCMTVVLLISKRPPSKTQEADWISFKNQITRLGFDEGS